MRDINHSKLWESDGQAFKTEAMTCDAMTCCARLVSSVAVRRAAIAALGGLPFHLGAAAGYGAARAAASTLIHWFLINLLFYFRNHLSRLLDLSKLAPKDSDMINMEKGSMHFYAKELFTSHLPARIEFFASRELSRCVIFVIMDLMECMLLLKNGLHYTSLKRNGGGILRNDLFKTLTEHFIQHMSIDD